MKAKHNELPQDFLDSLGVTNNDLKSGLKLPINAYTGALRAKFNKLYDPVQGFSICTTGQLLILQLIYDLQLVPTLEMVSANTDAVMYTIEEEYKEQAHKVLHNWESLTGLELEEDKVVKIIMRDVNNYAEIVQTGDNDYEVHYKGGEFKGKHRFKWNKEKHIFEYSFDDDIEANSLTIVSEALLKNLLFDIPLEETINKCNDIFRFQIISHLGYTYEKCVQESPNGDIELQRNNRIYAGKNISGTVIKVKSDGRRDSLAMCPPNPIVDNANDCAIDDINKEWYIKIALQKRDDFLGIKRLTEYKKTELLELASSMNIDVDNKIKKDDLIKIIEEKKYKERNEVKEMAENKVKAVDNIYTKLNKIKESISKHEFVLDCVLPSNMNNKEYASIGQYYTILEKECLKNNVFFKWEVIDCKDPYKELFKPVGKMAQHVWDVICKATFINCDNPEEITEFLSIASGSDSIDKGISSASTLAFRNFFDKNFTPSYLNQGGEEETIEITEKSEEPKIPTYIPPEKKEEIKKEVVETVQKTESDKDEIKEVIDNIMKVRQLSGKEDWGKSTLEKLMSGDVSTADILEISLKVQNKLDSLEG